MLLLKWLPHSNEQKYHFSGPDQIWGRVLPLIGMRTSVEFKSSKFRVRSKSLSGCTPQSSVLKVKKVDLFEEKIPAKMQKKNANLVCHIWKPEAL